MNFFGQLAEKIGHGVKVAAKDTAHGVKVAAVEVEHVSVKAAIPAGELAAQVLLPPPVSVTVKTILEMVSAHFDSPGSEVGNTTEEKSNMNPLETFAITMVLGIVQSTVKNPQHAAILKTQLIGVADQIYMTYGLVPASLAPPAPETPKQ